MKQEESRHTEPHPQSSTPELSSIEMPDGRVAAALEAIHTGPLTPQQIAELSEAIRHRTEMRDVFSAHSSAVVGVVQLTDGTIISVGTDGVLKMSHGSPNGEWECSTVFKAKKGTFSSLQALPSGGFVTVRWDGKESLIERWIVDEKKNVIPEVLSRLYCHEIIVLTDNSIVATDYYRLFHLTADKHGLWKEKEIQSDFKRDIANIRRLGSDMFAVTDHISLCSIFSEGRSCKWARQDIKGISIGSLDWLSDGVLMTGGLDGFSYLLTKGQNGRWDSTLINSYNRIRNIESVKDGVAISIGTRGDVCLRTYRDEDPTHPKEELLFTIPDYLTRYPTSVSRFSDGRFAVGMSDGEILIWPGNAKKSVEQV